MEAIDSGGRCVGSCPKLPESVLPIRPICVISSGTPRPLHSPIKKSHGVRSGLLAWDPHLPNQRRGHFSSHQLRTNFDLFLLYHSPNLWSLVSCDNYYFPPVFIGVYGTSTSEAICVLGLSIFYCLRTHSGVPVHRRTPPSLHNNWISHLIVWSNLRSFSQCKTVGHLCYCCVYALSRPPAVLRRKKNQNPILCSRCRLHADFIIIP